MTLRSDEEIAAARIGPPEIHNSTIHLAPYDPEWPRLFEREEQRIRAALGDRALLIEHAGSTSVPGLSAKPIIDIVLAVADTTDELAYVQAMEAAGYVLHIREPDWHQQRLFKGPDTAVNLHVFTIGCAEIERMLCFRDHLRSNEADSTLYENAKQELARRTWRYVQHYADAKSQLVEEILSRSGVTPRDCVRH
ncbi:MAG TPA: GrpB family protein [Candidatus Limnocylindrales bacterium]